MKHRTSKRPRGNDPVEAFRKRFTRIWRLISVSVIVLWTLWTLLDAFVIPRDIVVADASAGASTQTQSGSREEAEAQQDKAEKQEETETQEEGPSAEGLTEEETGGEVPAESLTAPVITDTSYDDGDIYIELGYMRTLDTDVYIAEILLSDPAYLKTALAEGAFGRNLTDTTSNIAEQNGAILAINGDYYGFRDSGYVMRNGYLYRSEPAKDPEQEDLVLYEDGSVGILRESEYTAEEIKESGAVDIFSFGPGLVIDGEVTVSSGDEVKRAQVTNPRTAFGLISPLHYLFVVSDGRTDESTGLSLLELADLMKELGCVTAYNLDGGGSSTIWFNGKVLNQPTTFGDTIAEREVSDIVYIGK